MSPLVEQPVDVAVVDYGMGNRRSVEKALEHVGARAQRQLGPRPPAPSRRPGRAGRGRVPARDGEPARAGPGRADARARARRHAGARHLPRACSWRSTPRSELGGAAGLGLIAGEVHGAARGDAEAAAHRLERGRASRKPDSPLIAGLPLRCAFYHVHSLAAVPPSAQRTCSARPTTAAPFVTAVAEGLASTACSSTPRSPRRRACGCSANFARICVARTRQPDAHARVKLYPAIDILGGNAVRLVKGDFGAKKVYDAGPAVGGARVGGGEARAGCTSSTSTGRGPASRSTSSTCARSPRSSGVPVQYGGGLRSTRGDRSTAFEAGASARDPGHGGLHGPRAARAGAGRARPGAGGGRRSTRAAAVSRRTAGSRPTEVPAREAIAALERGEGVRELRLHRTSTTTACSTGPNLEDAASAVRGGRRRQA